MPSHINWYLGLPTKLELRILWIAWLLFAWAIWWGGLSFYAMFVVPIATDLIGSTAQGFVTQQVTSWHNLLFIGLILCLTAEALKFPNRLIWATVILMALLSVALLYWHAKLTAQMDFPQQSVNSDFYPQHAVYLWLTTLEWLAGFTVPFCLRRALGPTSKQ